MQASRRHEMGISVRRAYMWTLRASVGGASTDRLDFDGGSDMLRTSSVERFVLLMNLLCEWILSHEL